MEKKLTKNDSMCSAYYDCTSLVDPFEQLLRSYNVYHIYFATFYDLYLDEMCSNYYDEWRNWADMINPKHWIDFVKDCDPNPNRLIDWHKINNDWREWLSANLNN